MDADNSEPTPSSGSSSVSEVRSESLVVPEVSERGGAIEPAGGVRHVRQPGVAGCYCVAVIQGRWWCAICRTMCTGCVPVGEVPQHCGQVMTRVPSIWEVEEPV